MPTKSIAELREMVGETRRTVEGFTVEAGKVEEFARAVKDDNPAHRDDAAAEAQGFERRPAPLTFSRTAYFPRYRPDGVDEIRPFDLGFRSAYSVHGEQSYEFERPVHVGDTLHADVTLADVYRREGSAGGEMTFAEFEFEYLDADGDLVFTERQTVIETGGPIDDSSDGASGDAEDGRNDGDGTAEDGRNDGDRERGDGGGGRTPREPRGMTDAYRTPLAGDSVAVGDEAPPVVVEDLERRDFVRYAGASGDFNPIHYDEPYATRAGNESVFAQGMLTAGFAAHAVADWFGLANVRTYTVRFRARVFPGDTVTASGVVTGVERTDETAVVDADLAVTNQDGTEVLSGSATAELPNDP